MIWRRTYRSGDQGAWVDLALRDEPHSFLRVLAAHRQRADDFFLCAHDGVEIHLLRRAAVDLEAQAAIDAEVRTVTI